LAGYSGTPLPIKLGIKEGATVAFPGAPEGFEATLGALPERVVIKRRAVAPLAVIVAFFRRRAALERRFERLAEAIYPDGGLWIAWPKRASGMPTDITEDTVRELALAAGLVDNKVCAIDETWSGLRVVHRVESRGRR
jgi:hypothetical protein